MGRLAAFGEVVRACGNRCLLLVPREQVRETVDRVLGAVSLDDLDDFRVLSPSLEDVYLQLGGKEKD